MKRIKQISVKNLFGMFDHTIALNLDERITIIHGPNGFGKTAILRLLDSLFSQNNSALKNTPFDEFCVQFEDDTDFKVIKIIVTSDEHNIFNTGYSEITFYFIAPFEEEPIVLPLLNAPIKRISAKRRIQLANIYPDDIRMDPEEEAKERNYDLLEELRQSMSLRLIETQRLQSTRVHMGNDPFDDPRSVVELSVITYSQELARLIKTKLAESTTLSQSLDRTFPARLVNPTLQKQNVAEDDLRKKLVELEHKRLYLTTTGLLDQEGTDSIQVQDQDQINENTKVVLSVYAEDTEKKLGVFDELANKIDLLKRIINKRFLYKEMTISKDEGFVFTNAKGVVLSPNDLSSGEQHELILFYELLFKVAPGSLILIDEPEISLHVVWQEQFLEDVLAVTRLSNIDVLLATHSPDIIAGRRDLMVELKGPM